ncbi:MAG: transglutaminase domain-containing protein [Cyclobacteriaceae bacterium]|nr:transglutaminase domain-containing protein [Cyclobacteriaceae bacterium]
MRNLIIVGMLLVSGSCSRPVEEKKTIPVRKVTIAEIEAGIKQYIQETTVAEDGYFHVTDRGQEFRMNLVRVHTEYLANLGPGKHFACVDLADVSGDVYDVDFFMAGEPGAMQVTETTIHKLNGKPFYAWKQRADKTWHRVSVDEASTRLLGVIEGSDEFEFRYQVQLPELTAPAKMWIPIATSDPFQTVNVKSMSVPGTYQFVQEADYGNTILYVELDPAQSGKELEILYEVHRKERGVVEEAGTIPARYLAGNTLMPVGGRFADIAKEALIGKWDASDLIRARALYDYVIDNMRYMKFGNYGNGDSNYACDVRTGNCSEFHSLFISLARSSGIPARFAIGAAIPSERNDGGIDGYHCWAEFYADGKWWPIDISEGNKYTALATYYFGHHPANRVELSRGRDLRVNPAPQTGPINFLAYPLLEVNGKRTDTRTTFSFTRTGKPA